MSQEKQDKNKNAGSWHPGYFRGYPKKESEPKEEAEADLKNHKKIEKFTSGNSVLIILALLVAFVTGTMVYAVYSFVHVSRLSDLAGIHVTPSIKKATSELLNGENNSMAGYDDWLDYRNNVFEFKYPNDWELKEDGNLVTARKYNGKVYNYFDSLAASVSFGEANSLSGKSLEELINNGKSQNINYVQGIIGGKDSIRTGKRPLENGLSGESIYWQLGDNIFHCEVVYYNQNTADLEADFDKIVKSIKFL